MRRRHDDDLLLDMLPYSRRISTRIARVQRDQFDADEDLQLALVYLIQIIREAASRISQSQRSAHAEIPWASIVGMGHVVVHDYLHVDLDVVWDTVTNSIPALIAR